MYRRSKHLHGKAFSAKCAVTVLLLLFVFFCLFTGKRVATPVGQVASGARRRPLITFSQIGYEGRLGNQLFQIAATIGLAEKLGLSWGFFQNLNNCSAGRLFNLSGSLENSGNIIEYRETSGVYSAPLWKKVPNTDFISLAGYFQDYRYFDKSLVTLDEYFKFQDKLLQIVRTEVPEVDSAFSVALHVRRGDYIELSELYGVLDAEYYLRALSLIAHRIDVVIIVSDDVQWCKEHLVSRIPYRVILSPFQDELCDFLLLHLSRVIVIANSSFSWWAAFLKYARSPLKMDDENVRVFAPRTWYNPSGDLAYMNSNEYFFPPKWTRVRN